MVPKMSEYDTRSGMNFAFRKASGNGHLEVVKYLAEKI